MRMLLLRWTRYWAFELAALDGDVLLLLLSLSAAVPNAKARFSCNGVRGACTSSSPPRFAAAGRWSPSWASEDRLEVVRWPSALVGRALFVVVVVGDGEEMLGERGDALLLDAGA